MNKEIKDFISSGIIEIYCMGLASDEEKKLVEEFASGNKEVRDEIDSVSETLNQYVRVYSKVPDTLLKNKILTALLNSDNNRDDNANTAFTFPPRLTTSSSASEWKKYISDNNISSPENFDMFHVLDLPGDDKQVTYIAWAKKGAVLEETHENEDEYLLMLQGKCSVTIDGKIGYYKEGDIVYVPGKALHRAEALSDEPMILIGQRIAA